MADSISFDRAIEFYDRTRGFPEQMVNLVGEFIYKTAQLSSESSVLEVGIGTGRIAMPLSTHVKQITGIDISAKMMGVLQQKFTGSNIYVAQADGMQLPFADNQFDTISLTHILHLVADSKQVVHELARVLRPSGVLIHSGNHRETPALKDAFDAYYEVAPGPKRVWLKQIRELLQSLGWQEHTQDVLRFEDSYQARNDIEYIEQRLGSRSWNTSDEDHDMGMAALHKVLQERGITPETIVESTIPFSVDVYRPPQ